MHLENDALVLGARTVLAKRDSDGALEIDGEEARLATLLAVAYGGPVDPSVLASIRGASKYARAGNECMATMHIALARLSKLIDPDDAARRLFIADGLIAEGVAPRDIWLALEFDPTSLDELEKYSPSQPRNPAGEHKLSGEWTREGASGAEAGGVTEASPKGAAEAGTAAEEALLDETRAAGHAAFGTAARRLATFGAAAVPVVDVFDVLLNSTSGAMPAPVEGTVPGRPDLRYVLDLDQRFLRIYQPPYPGPLVDAELLGSEFRDKRRQRKVARLLTTGIQFNPQALPPERTSPKDRKSGRPRLCVIQQPDRTGSDELDRDYEDFVKAKQNRPPTKRGYGYWLRNPADRRPVVIDDCRLKTDTPIEIKRGYSGFVASTGGRIWMAVDWGYQATRQAEASDGHDIEWHFSDKPAADWAREVFSWLPWLARVKVVWDPWKGHR